MPLSDALLLRAGLRAAGLRWRAVPLERCEVLLGTDLATMPKAPRDHVVRIVTGPRRTAPADIRFLDRWPSTGQLADTIATARRAANSPVADAAAARAPAQDTPTSVGAWLARVGQASASAQRLQLDNATAAVAWIEPATQSGWVAPGVATALPAALGDAVLRVRTATREVPAEALRCSSAHVLWALALGREWTVESLDIERHRRLRLRRWPDFGSLERRDTFLRVASQLISAPTSVESLLAAHPGKHADVLALIAGCRLCGWLDVTDNVDRDAPPRPDAPARSPLHAAMGKLRRALGMRGTA